MWSGIFDDTALHIECRFNKEFFPAFLSYTAHRNQLTTKNNTLNDQENVAFQQLM